jgi:phage tail protein X
MFGPQPSWLVALTVILIGVLIALPFRRESPPEEPDEWDLSHLTEGLIWQEDTASLAPTEGHFLARNPRQRLHHDDQVTAVAATESVGVRDMSPPRMEPQYGSLAERYQAPRHALGERSTQWREPRGDSEGSRLDGLVAERASADEAPFRTGAARTPPASQPAYPPSFSAARPTVSDSFPPETTSSSRRWQEPAPSQRSSDRPPDNRSNGPPVTPPRLHRIVDGDSLPALAARYLGDASRAEEIYAANRDLLERPDLLPLGKQLRIP